MTDNIPQQKQVRQDIYNILSQIAVDVQTPENVAINTSNDIHTIQNWGYNLNTKHYGSYEYAISLKIGVDYNIKDLTATILTAHIENIFPKIIREVDKNANKTTIDAIECKFYNNGICASPINKKETKCKNIPTEWCYFKQLARAKEEIEKWKHQAELGSDTTDRLSKQLEQKEQECETLKSENFTFEELVKTQDDEIEKLKKNLQLSPKFSIENGVAHYTITQEEYEKLKDKEQECEELISQRDKFEFGNNILEHERNTYKQALDEIEKILDNGTADTQTNNAKWLHEYYLARFCEIREIINNAKDGE